MRNICFFGEYLWKWRCHFEYICFFRVSTSTAVCVLSFFRVSKSFQEYVKYFFCLFSIIIEFFLLLERKQWRFFPLPFLHLFTEDHISSSNNCIHKTKEKQQHQIKISLIILAVDKTMKIDREGVREKHMKKNEKTNRKYMSLLLFKTK